MKLPLRGDEVSHPRRLFEKLAHVLLDKRVGLRQAGRTVLEFEQRVEVAGLDETAEVVRIVIDVPGIGAVAHPLMADLVHEVEKSLAVLRIDPVFDDHQNWPPLVLEPLREDERLTAK